MPYFDNDFDVEEWRDECAKRELLPITTRSSLQYCEQWNNFYSNHTSGSFYKPRKYLYDEFASYLRDSSVVLEVGCGHGCSIFPLLPRLNCNFIATDYSLTALDILHQSPLYDSHRITTRIWDATLPWEGEVPSDVSCLLCIFMLSAVDPADHIATLCNMRDVLCNDGVICFRDYAEYDMTMFRHQVRIDNKLYLRPEGTFAYYFDCNYLRTISEAAGLDCVDVKYATVINRNKKTGAELRRVFIHAVLKKPS